MGCLSGCIGLPFLLVGLGSIWILIQIGGKSDGPGALLFYIGAFFGLMVGVPLVLGSLIGSGESKPQEPWP